MIFRYLHKMIRLVVLTAVSAVLLSPSVYASPSLEKKIGQMLMVGFRGESVDQNHFIIRDIKEHNLGGVILFDYDVINAEFGRNIRSPQQVRELVSSLQKTSGNPLLIAVDQEGGLIARLKERYGFPKTVSHTSLGITDRVNHTYSKTAELAETLSETGFNINMAPVVDLCVNPHNPIIAEKERCFSADPEKTAEHASAYIKAHHRYGIATTLKHFPGHGSSKGDSHLGLTDITSTWSKEELIPYRNIIKAGMADVVMTAHVFNRNIDDTYPATLSGKAIDGILRKQLGFDGVVISDDMQMGAIANHYGFEKAIGLAVKAGVDILVFGNNLQYDKDIVPRVIGIIRKMVQSGQLSEDRINKSYDRIMKLKSRYF